MKFVRFWLPLVAWMLAIFVFSSHQRLQVSDDVVFQFVFFKSLHIIEYGFLFALWFRALRNTTGLSQSSAMLWSFVLTVLYGATDELHQLFVPTRDGKAADVLIDAVGAGIAHVSIWKLLPKAPKPLRRWARSWQLQ